MQYYFVHEKVGEIVTLDQQESHHCTKVMRRQVGDIIHLLDGNGSIIKSEITSLGKEVRAKIISSERQSKLWNLSIAVSPTKSADRMEWMIEKLVEIGVEKVVFIRTKNSERSKIQERRIRMKALAALKQSGNYYLPKIEFDVTFKELLASHKCEENYLAHCYSDLGDKFAASASDWGNPRSTLIAIGPEGDFSREEVEDAVLNGFRTLDLGKTRLRTETAAIVACTLFNN